MLQWSYYTDNWDFKKLFPYLFWEEYNIVGLYNNSHKFIKIMKLVTFLPVSKSLLEGMLSMTKEFGKIPVNPHFDNAGLS